MKKTLILSALFVVSLIVISGRLLTSNAIADHGQQVACTQQYDPVCGVDGKTYGNSCSAGLAHVAIAYAGGCQVSTPTPTPTPPIYLCTQQYDPVCGVDGKTYSNSCYASQAKVAVAYTGGCQVATPSPTSTPTPTPQIYACTEVYTPVCGVDGKTYSNSCYASQAKVAVAYTGKCIIGFPGPRINKLIRASNSPRVYYVTEKGYLRWVPNEKVFLSYGNKWSDVVVVDSAQVEGRPEVALIRALPDPRVFKLENGIKRWVVSPEAFIRAGFSWNLIAPVNTTEMDYYPMGADIN